MESLRHDVTKPQNEQTLKHERDDGEESIAEDVSLATTVDSELERVISSAAAAVEEFGVEELGVHSPEPQTVNTMASELSSPRPPTRNLNEVVDTITDGILHMVVKDSMETVGQLSERSAMSTPEPQHVPKDVPHEVPVSDTEAAGEKEAGEHQPPKDQALEVATNKLLNESLSQMLSIYKRKKSQGDEKSPEAHASSTEEEEVFEEVRPADAPKAPSGEKTRELPQKSGNFPSLADPAVDGLLSRPDTANKVRLSGLDCFLYGDNMSMIIINSFIVVIVYTLGLT